MSLIVVGVFGPFIKQISVMFKAELLLVKRIAVIEKAEGGFTNGFVPDASTSVSHKHVAVDETRIGLGRQPLKDCQYLHIHIVPIPVFVILGLVACN